MTKRERIRFQRIINKAPRISAADILWLAAQAKDLLNKLDASEAANDQGSDTDSESK
ncbi:MAG: hypothetical protein KDH96_01945 [Candidatus Riesia sp.]|nr:hypothetical protein [Candidatus Riesia sp.]